MNAIEELYIEPTEPANGPGHEDPPDPGTGTGTGGQSQGGGS